MGVRSLTIAASILGFGLSATAQMGNMPMGHEGKAAAPPSTSLVLSTGQTTKTLTLVDLRAMPQEKVMVTNGHTKKTETYGGVPVAALLAKLGMPFVKENEPALLRSYLVVEGTDGYVVVVSAYEALSAVHEGSAIVADTVDGQPLGPAGAFELMLSSDKRPQRWVRNLASITVETVRR